VEADRERFTDLFGRHRDAVHAYLLGRTHDRELAADLTQDTFLRAWRNADTLDGWDDDRQRAWLFTVARNLVVDHHRLARTRTTSATAPGHLDPAAVPTDDPADRVAHGDQLDRVDAAIAALPEDLRVVLVMTVVGNMTSRQIADALGVPAGTVRSRLHDARQHLAAVLQEATP
jgi:RNA polymerase sigma-70 factor, ECF subfamily